MKTISTCHGRGKKGFCHKKINTSKIIPKRLKVSNLTSSENLPWRAGYLRSKPMATSAISQDRDAIERSGDPRISSGVGARGPAMEPRLKLGTSPSFLRSIPSAIKMPYTTNTSQQKERRSGKGYTQANKGGTFEVKTGLFCETSWDWNGK